MQLLRFLSSTNGFFTKFLILKERDFLYKIVHCFPIESNQSTFFKLQFLNCFHQYSLFVSLNEMCSFICNFSSYSWKESTIWIKYWNNYEKIHAKLTNRQQPLNQDSYYMQTVTSNIQRIYKKNTSCSYHNQFLHIKFDHIKRLISHAQLHN